jgi:hypothetical protein
MNPGSTSIRSSVKSLKLVIAQVISGSILKTFRSCNRGARCKEFTHGGEFEALLPEFRNNNSEGLHRSVSSSVCVKYHYGTGLCPF